MKKHRYKDEPTTEKSEVAKLLLGAFGHTSYAIAVERAEGISYRPAQGELTEELLEQHLDGKITLGSYALTEADQVWWMGWDVDSNDLKVAKEYAKKIIDSLESIPHCVEFSGGKGYHIIIFLSKPMMASQAKQAAEFIREKEGLPRSGKSHVECYPKQAKLTPSNPMGNLLKIPLGLHPRAKTWSMFIDPYNGWEAGNPVNPIEVLSQRAEPEKVLALLTESVDAYQAIIQSMIGAWQSGERHSLALNLSGYLANVGWGMEQVKELVEDICHAAGDDEVRNRLQTVEDTFKKLSEGKTVAGYMYLADTLPGAVMKTLVDMARLVSTPPIMKKLEAIRLDKGANFQKVSESADLIWTHLSETGMLLKTRTNELFWYSRENHLITELGTDAWLALFHKFYGVNPAEAFGKQVLTSIELKARSDAKTVDVHTRSYWSGEQLFVNLGGAEVYILDGEDIEIQYNGECGVIFRTVPDLRLVPVPNFESGVNAWEFLTDDLSFNSSEEVAAKPNEQVQLLRAWILCFFFPQLMETKPILCALGSPGSGKTSMMRRIVRVIEGLKEDVISLSEDKPDSVRASIERHRLMVLDNLEQTKAKWLVNLLNTLSTGSAIELRTLFKTNEVYRIEPSIFVAITATNIPFSESTLHSRLLPVELSTIQDIIPESVIQRRIRQNLEGIWGSLLMMLNSVVYELKITVTVKAPIQSRLADFTVFCARIADAEVLDHPALISGLMNLIDRQRAQMLQSSPIVEVLEDWVESYPEEAAKWMSYGKLMDHLNDLAFKKKIFLERVTTAAALKRHLDPRMPALRKLYGAEARLQKDGHGKTVEYIRFGQPQQLDFSVTKKEPTKKKENSR